MERDAVAVRAAIEVPLCELGPLRIDLERVDPAVVREPAGHRERGVAAERADLEHALRLPEPDEQLEQAAGHRPGEHLLHPELLAGRLGELGEQRLVRRAHPLHVLLDARVDDVH